MLGMQEWPECPSEIIKETRELMSTRRSRNKDLTVAQHLHAHDDDLDDGAQSFASLRKEVRAILALVVTILLTIIGGLLGRI